MTSLTAPRFRSLIFLGLFFAFGPIPEQEGWANTQTGYYERSPAEQGFLTAGAVGCSLVYTPIKACYAAGGTVAGGMVFLMSAGQSATAAGKILERSTRGDWYVHPDHLTGQRRLRFRGSTHIGGGR